MKVGDPQSHAVQHPPNGHYHLRNWQDLKVPYKGGNRYSCHSCVASGFDHGNILLYELPSSPTSKLQTIPNVGARILTLTGSFHPTSPVLKEFHWLRIEFRILVLCLMTANRALDGLTPTMHHLIQPYQPSRALCDSPQYSLKLY